MKHEYPLSRYRHALSIAELEDWQPLEGSVASTPRRDQRFGRADFPGNCDGSLFKALILRYGPNRIADPMMGSGTTRDVVAFMNSSGMGYNLLYWGGDLRSGFDLATDAMPGPFDLVWVHPPYWDIIRYSEDPKDLSTCTDFVEFVRRMERCLRKCYESLAVGGRLAILIGDVRKGGVYYSLLREVLNMMPHLGQLRSVIVKVQHACRSDAVRYPKLEDPRILHEYCVVFKRCR